MIKNVTPLIIKNLKFRMREPQQFLFIFGFPIMFLGIFYLLFKGMPIEGPGKTMFDYFIWGLIAFITAFAVQSASVAFSLEKSTGTLKRLQTTPVGSSNAVFLGFISSEVIVVMLQLGLVYILAFGLLQVYVVSVMSLILTFFIYVLISITMIGLGLILASVLSDKLASQMPMILIMPFIFLSGAIMPLETEIIYINPLFWAHQLSLSIGYYGEGSLFNTIKLFNFTTQQVTDTHLVIIWALPIMILSGILFLVLGILMFKKSFTK